MEAARPYLLDDGDGLAHSDVSVACDVDAAMIEMDVRGRWTSHLGTDVTAMFAKCLADHPPAIVVNLWGLEDPYAASAATWLHVCRRAAILQPPVRVALTLPVTTPLADRLRRIGPRLIPIYPTNAQARAAVAGRAPLTDQLQSAGLPPEPASVRTARGVVDFACDAWNLPELRYPCRLVVTELVINAVEYAGTDMVLTVWRRGAGLHISVRDGDPRPPVPRRADPGGPLQRRGHGLQIVEAISTGWGSIGTRDGKVVWATVRSCRRRSF